MKLPPIKKIEPIKTIRALYHANKPMQPCRPSVRTIREIEAEQSSLVKWFKNLFK